MSARRFALLAGLAFFVMFVSANVVANSWFRAWRIDLTESRLYSLSEGTRRTLDDLSEPLELTLYYSRDSAAPLPQLQAYAARVRELLQTYQARSHGRVRFVEVNVVPFSEEEDDAQRAGIEPLRPYEGADPIYFGLSGANAIDDQRSIAAFDPQREAFLEYEVTRLIHELEHPDRTKVALITALPLDPALGAIPGLGANPPAFAVELNRLWDVETLAADFSEIPDVDVLAIIHPWPLTEAQLYAIDQFILRKGRAFIALDPASLQAEEAAATPNPFSAAPAPTSSSLAPLLARWGVEMTPGVVLDLENALDVGVQNPQTGQFERMPQPLFFAVPAAQMDREDLITAALRRGVNFGLSGALTASSRDGVEATPLARTSGRTMRMTAAEALARPSPLDILRTWPASGGRIETVALHLAGDLETAFPNGRPPADPVAEGEPPPPAPATPAEPLTRSATPAQIVIVADTDFLADDFYLDPQSGVAAADNAAFAINAIDVLSGSDALVSLRSRAPSLRRMERVEAMEREAQSRIEQRRDELTRELEEAEAQLANLQARGRGSGFFTGDLGAELTPEENATIERFRTRAIEARGELRRVQRELRGDIDRLKAGVVFVNMWLGPLLVAGAGLFLFWRRQRRGRARR